MARLAVTSCQSARIATPSSSAGAAARSQPKATPGSAPSLIGRLSEAALPARSSDSIAPSGGDVAGASRVSSVICRLRWIVTDHSRLLAALPVHKNAAPAESLDL